MTSQKFGGDWTAKKLNIFTSYLDAYLIALQNQKFNKIYIDAFAGTGEIETSDGEAYLAGSAKRALSAERRFDHYYFIESDESKASELEHMIDTEFPHLKRFTTVYRGDANEKLGKIINDIDWRFSRGLLFLDPYATQVDWATLECVAVTKSIDVWYCSRFQRSIGCCLKTENTDRGKTQSIGYLVITVGEPSFTKKIRKFLCSTLVLLMAMKMKSDS